MEKSVTTLTDEWIKTNPALLNVLVHKYIIPKCYKWHIDIEEAMHMGRCVVFKCFEEQKLKKLPYSIGALFGQLHYNFLLSYFGTKRKEKVVYTSTYPTKIEPHDPLKDDENKEFVNKLLEKLSVRDREIIKHRFFHNRTLVETGKEMKIPYSTVDVYEKRALARMREIAEQHY